MIYKVGIKRYIKPTIKTKIKKDDKMESIKTDKKWQDEHRHFIKSDRAVSEVVGNVLMLGITVLAVSTILLYGVPSIQRLEETATIKNVEQIYTILDSRASSSILGNSPIQTTDMDLGGGSLSVIPNGTGNSGNINRESYMVVQSDNGTFNIVVPMGKLAYRLSDRVVAYEGGGVWSQYPSGSVMLSPPEFNYNGQTLTLPTINISGSDSQGGKGTVRISTKKNLANPMTTLYPTGGNKTNPLDYNVTGKIYLSVTSDYYDAWADYIHSQLYARIIEKNATTRTSKVELRVVPNTLGGDTLLTNPINMRGIPVRDNALKNFSLRIYPSIKNNNNLYPIDWDIRAKSGSKTLILYIKMTQDPAELKVGYQDSAIESSGETWGSAFYHLQTDGTGRQYIDINLLDKNMNLTYSNLIVGADNGKSNSQYCRTPTDTFKINGANDPALSWDGTLINTTTNNGQYLYNITGHYISKMAQEGGIVFYQCNPAADNGKHGADTPPSSLLLDYDAEGDITYLYITDNHMNVEID